MRARGWGSLVGVSIVAFFIGLSLADHVARAEPQPPRRRVVVMNIAAPAGVLEMVVERLQPRLEAQLVDLVAMPVDVVDVRAILDDTEADADAPFAEVWLDGRSTVEATLWLVPSTRDRVLTHGTQLPAGFDEVALAELVFVVERSVAALLDAQQVGVPKDEARAQLRPAAPPPAVARTAPATPVARRAFGLAAFGGAEAWSGSAALAPVVGIVGTREREREGRLLGVSATATWRRGFAEDAGDTHLDVTGASVHVALSLGRRFEGLGTGRIAFGPGLLVDRLRATHAGAGGQAVTQERTDVDLSLGLRLRWDIGLGRQGFGFAMIGADLVAVAGRYTATIDGVRSVLATAWPVRPMFALGLGLGR